MLSKLLNNRKTLIAFGIIGIIMIAGVTILAVSRSGSTTTPTTTEATPSPTPEAAAKGPGLPSFTNFENLQEYGPTEDQMDDLKYAFGKYKTASKKSFSNVTLKPETILNDPVDYDSPYNTLHFDVTFDGKDTLQARFDCTQMTAAKLTLTQNDKVVFQSELIDLYNGIGNQ